VIARFMESVRERPPHEAPLEALRQAVVEGWDTLNEVVESVVPIEKYLRMYHVIESSPVLLAAHLRRSVEIEETIARVLAERQGVDVDADPRPRLTVAVFGGVMRLTERRWATGGDFTLEAMREMTISYLEQVGPALTESWRAH
jgi:AcrR family transcriptional regulator